MLVVLMVMGLLLGLVTVSLRTDERGLLTVEAERLAQLLSLAAQEARLTGKPIRWVGDEAEYRFWRQRPDGGWGEIRDNDVLRARKLPDGMAISALRVASRRSQGVMQLEFIPYSSPLLFTVELSLGNERTFITSSLLGDVRAVHDLTRKGDDNASPVIP